MILRVQPTNMTVAEFCQQLNDGSITVNQEYQRTSTVWPLAARSYLIDTIILGFPMPKISLHQRTDVRAKKTTKEIVDGQQRSRAILDFFNNKLTISGKSEFSGLNYDNLDDELRTRFLDYSITIDLFTGADEALIRQVFRRINSYNVPLNNQETRHATYQGPFKWFIYELSDRYSQVLKDSGAFKERDLSRMEDAKFIAELCVAIDSGIQTYADKKIEEIYKKYDTKFPMQPTFETMLTTALDRLFSWGAFYQTPLMHPRQMYPLLLAVICALFHVPTLNAALDPVLPAKAGLEGDDWVANNLGLLATALEDDVGDLATIFGDFVEASSEATNTRKNRVTRFNWFYMALTETRLVRR